MYIIQQREKVANRPTPDSVLSLELADFQKSWLYIVLTCSDLSTSGHMPTQPSASVPRPPEIVILDTSNPPWGSGCSGVSHGCSRNSGPKQKLSGYDPVLQPENPSPTSPGQRITTCLNPLGGSGSQPHPEHRKRKKRTPRSLVQVRLWRWDGDDLQKKFYKD